MPINKIIRWGILGAGNIAHSFVKDFSLMKNAKLAAIAASDIERARNFAASYTIPLALNYEQLYHSNEIDAVYISTTHNFHFEQALKCLENGKAVLCEKPITVNDREFKKLMAASKANNVFLMEAMWTYFLPALQQAKQWVDDGRIGKLKVIQADFAFPAEKIFEGRLYNPMLAGGALLDIGIYPIALAYYFTNQNPGKISASANMTLTGVDEQVGMLFQYGDTSAVLFCSIATRMSNAARIFGELGHIELPVFWEANTARLYDNENNLVEEFNDDRTSFGFIYEMQHANDMILQGNMESPVMPHSRSNAIQETMMEVRRQIGLRYPFE